MVRRTLEVGAVVWAMVGVAVALASLGDVNDDARLLVGTASVLGPLAALTASWFLRRLSDRAAGVLLLISAATPTYFAFVLNVPALLVGIVLAVAPGSLSARDLRT
jgi:hypothetical protein